MPAPRPTVSSSSSFSRQPTTSTTVRRNLFHQHLSRRPTTSSTSTSAETLRLDTEAESDTSGSDIVIRDKNGEFEVEGPDLRMGCEEEGVGDEEGREGEKERQRLADAVKHHTRDRNRAPSEPAELLDAVRTSSRAKVAALAEDNWMYEAEEEQVMR